MSIHNEKSEVRLLFVARKNFLNFDKLLGGMITKITGRSQAGSNGPRRIKTVAISPLFDVSTWPLRETLV